MVIELAPDDDDEGGGVGIPRIEGGSQFAFAFRDGVNASSVPSTPYKAATCVVPFRRRVDAEVEEGGWSFRHQFGMIISGVVLYWNRSLSRTSTNSTLVDSPSERST